MRIGRTIPPAAAPLSWTDLWTGVIGSFSPGPSVQALEEQIRQHFGVRYVFLVSSGTAAMTLTLKAGMWHYVCDVPRHDELGMHGDLTVK